ncbi:MAG: hypothetical protein EKK53_22245 [Burkholderiales bacterium]|nr:MAG: hypothetical protein EKK53_22245 [Burkholderiales bacterium]
MLTLTADQLAQVQDLQLRRDAQSLLAVLSDAWPAVAQQLQARWPAFVDVALARGRALGLATVADLARYASLCCLWGASFETRPRFEWAAALAADPGLPPSLKLHQLTHRSREELVRRAAKAVPGGEALTPAGFDQALAALEAGLAQAARGRALFLDQPPPPRPRACDLAQVSLALAEPADMQVYQRQDGRWLRVARPAAPAAPESFNTPPTEPRELAVLSRATGTGATARLQVAVAAQARCGGDHPAVQHTSRIGRLAWRGADTARLSLALHAPPAPPVDPKLGPAGLGHVEPPDVQALGVASCGVRDAGAPFGGLTLALHVHDLTQRLVEIRHGAAPTRDWPAADAPPPAAPNPTACHLEADGQAQPADAWRAAWLGLQPQAQAGLEQLFNAAGRAMAGTSAQLTAELSPLVGQASATWGWQRDAHGGVAPRVQLDIDFTALVLDLHLRGELDWAGSRARLSLRAQGRVDWRTALDLHDPAGLADAKLSWRHPVVLRLDAIATGEPALLSAGPLAEDLRGALVGSCGLRPRPDGRGHQWFFRLAVEPVHVLLLRLDPLAGEQAQRRELIPALTLIDWSAG